MSNNKKKNLLKTVLIVFSVLILAGVVGYGVAKFVPPAKAVSREAVEDAPQMKTDSSNVLESADPAAPSETLNAVGEMGRRVTYNGVTYTKKDNLKTILFLGVDNTGTKVKNTIGQGGRADNISLFVLDPENKTIQMMSISRDTIVGVDVYDTKGGKLYTGNMQLTMQYAYGNSASKSCRLMERRVGELIHGIDIDGYFSMTMDGLPEIIDGIGGLTVKMPEDYTMINKAYTKGAVVTMTGKEAERFIRYRDTKTTGSSNVRMARDAWLMGELFHQLRAGKFSVTQLLDLADAYIETDLDADTMKDLASYNMADKSYTMPGTSIEGKTHDEFYVDDDALIPILLELYYNKK